MDGNGVEEPGSEGRIEVWADQILQLGGDLLSILYSRTGSAGVQEEIVQRKRGQTFLLQSMTKTNSAMTLSPSVE